MAAIGPPELDMKPTFSARVILDTMSAARAATESEVLQKALSALIAFSHGGVSGEPTYAAVNCMGKAMHNDTEIT